MLEPRPVILRPSIFASGPVAAAFTTRHGGFSEAPYASLNLGMSTGDEAEVVLKNRIAVFSSLGFSSSQVAFAGQVHGHRVQQVSSPGLFRQTDGLVTDQPGLLLAITAADCAAVLLADVDARIVGACHAGWRGAAAGIVEITLETMTSLGATPSRIAAYVGPCIGSESFEVGPEVAERFRPEVVRHADDSDRAYVDLKQDVMLRLLEAGLSRESVEISPHCTVRAVGDFFSHRAEQGRTGRMLGLIGMPVQVASSLPAMPNAA
jgi:polyphenol oxidase